jgi:NADH-quinone oxidoreductase subunit M
MTWLLIIPIVGVVALYFYPSKKLALAISFIILLEVIRIQMGMTIESGEYQNVVKIGWAGQEIGFGMDGLSINFVLLTAILIPICIMVSWDSVKIMTKQYLMSLIIIEWLLIGVFTVMDLLGFYVLYEGVLIPMFYIIGVWGAREQKVTAAFYFFFYTLIGSVLMLISIMYIYSITGTTDYPTLMGYELGEKVQKIVFIGFIASLAVKIPTFPFHIWLPLAHVEAPVAGSVLLAGVLIKLGSYGLIRYGLGLMPIACEYYAPLIYTISILGVIYASLTTLRQTDLKRIIAYSSVGHMGIVTIGIFANNLEGVEGSIYLQIAHGVVSSGLFIIVTMLYERYHTRIVKYYRGVTVTMPIYSTVFLIMTMSNIGVPGTSNYIGEIKSLAGAMEENGLVAFLAAIGMVLSASYGLFLFNRVCYGSISSYFTEAPRDMSRRELYTMLPLVVLTLVLGVFPELIIEPMHASVYQLITK